MPIRKIPKNYRNITGIAPCNKAVGIAAYESSLERDFLTLLEFDSNVQHFEVQPIAIEWFDPTGKKHIYTPDVLVHYQNDVIIYEVKYRSDLRKNWRELKPKFQAALHFCKLQGWHFKLITELEIHTDYLCNVRFLLPYQQNGLSGEYSEAYMTLLDESLRELKKSTPKQLIQQTFQDEYNQAKLLPVLWYLIAERKIGADLNQPLTMQSAIWFKK